MSLGGLLDFSGGIVGTGFGLGLAGGWGLAGGGPLVAVWAVQVWALPSVPVGAQCLLASGGGSLSCLGALTSPCSLLVVVRSTKDKVP